MGNKNPTEDAGGNTILKLAVVLFFYRSNNVPILHAGGLESQASPMQNRSAQPSDNPFVGIIVVGSGVPHGPPARTPQALYIRSHSFILHPGRQDEAGEVKVFQSLSWNPCWTVVPKIDECCILLTPGTPDSTNVLHF